MFPKNVKNATWPERCRHRNEKSRKRETQKTRKREHCLPFSCFRACMFNWRFRFFAFSGFRVFAFPCFHVFNAGVFAFSLFRFFVFLRFRAFTCSMLAFSRFRVLPAAPPRPDTHFVCTGCFRVPNIYAKGRFEFLLFFWLPSFAVLGASFKECFFACFFSLGGGSQAKRKIKPSNRKPCLINYLSSSW